MIEEITIKFGTKLKLTQNSYKSQLYTIDGEVLVGPTGRGG